MYVLVSKCWPVVYGAVGYTCIEVSVCNRPFAHFRLSF